MNNKTDIENMKDDLINLKLMLGKKSSVSTKAIENMLEYTKQLKAKANKYDSLVEKIKEALDFAKTSEDTRSKAKAECLKNILKIMEE